MADNTPTSQHTAIRHGARDESSVGDLAPLLGTLRQLIADARIRAMRAVDEVQVQTCWQVGRHIVEFEQGGTVRAAYGKRLLPLLAEQLTADFGQGFDASNLRYMRLFYQAFPIRDALRHELSWTHYRLLTKLEREDARQWYMNEAATQNWSTRALQRQMSTLFYERLLLSQDKVAVAQEAGQKLAELEQSPRAFVRDPVMLEFLGLPGSGRPGWPCPIRRNRHDDEAAICPSGLPNASRLALR